MNWQRKGKWLIITIDKECLLSDIMTELHQTCEYQVVSKRKQRAEGVLYPNDSLWLQVFEEHEVDFMPQEGELEIVYEDDLLLVVNKPSGMLVHPDSKEGSGTLANLVAEYYIKQGIHTTVRPLHRLDYETSGLVIFSKCPKLQPYFDEQLAHKQIKRLYLAIVNGYYKPRHHFSIEAPIGRDRHVNGKRRVSETGKWAKTNVSCLDSSYKHKLALVECELESGRTHQIRVHLAYHKHPLVGDKLYNELPSTIRLCLHAYKLQLSCLLYELQLELPMARDMEQYWINNK